MQTKYIKLNELCSYLGIGRTTAYRREAAGQLPKSFLIGRYRYWVKQEVDAHIADLRETQSKN